MKKPPAKRPTPPAKKSTPAQSAPQPYGPVMPHVAVTMQKHSQWAGPLPPPEVLREFDELVPGSGERILAAWEKETSHRHMIERHDLWGSIVESILGKLLAFLFVMAVLGVAALAIYRNETGWGILLGGGIIVAVVGAFIQTNRPKKDASQK